MDPDRSSGPGNVMKGVRDMSLSSPDFASQTQPRSQVDASPYHLL
jgi:hypothetical protein